MSSEPTALPPGTRLGEDLTILGDVDTSGREPVYIVWHHKAWCPMACKVFTRLEKAEFEAQILSGLAHPNIVRCLGVAPPTCLLMEFLEGPTLHALVRSRAQKRLGIDDTLRVAVHLGAALHHVHRDALVHLDIKPANVIVAHGRPVLFDFGIARRLSEVRPDKVTGTEPYISPEECLRGAVTPAADVFGLGVTIYELLSGHMPWREGTDEEPYPQILEPPTPLRVHRLGVSKRLETIIMKCLERNPADRPSLENLLPEIHDMIRKGPRMWPADFRPS
jgi:serine/threonine protein kinase